MKIPRLESPGISLTLVRADSGDNDKRDNTLERMIVSTDVSWELGQRFQNLGMRQRLGCPGRDLLQCVVTAKKH